MKKFAVLLVAAAALFALALPVSAATLQQNQHQIADVLEITETAVEQSVYNQYHLTDAQMMEILRTAGDVVPEDYEIHHLTMLRQRDVTNDGEEIQLSLRAWGAGNRYLVVFFKPADEEEWTVVAAAQGEFIDATLPGDGQYALAWSWG